MTNFIDSQNPYINPFKTLEKYGNYLSVDNSGGGDFTTIQSAIDYITNATQDNKYVIDVYGAGNYEEQIVLDKPYIKLRFINNVLLKSDLTPVLDISNNNEIHENLNVKSVNSTLNSDTLFVHTACNPYFKDCIFFGSNGAYSARIDEALVYFINTQSLSNYNSIKLENSGVLIYSSGKILSGATYSDIIQEALTTIKFGVVEYDKDKCNFSGILAPILKAIDVEFDNSNINLPDNPKTVQEAIAKLTTQYLKVVHVDNTNAPYQIKDDEKLIYVDSTNAPIGVYLPDTTNILDSTPVQIFAFKYANDINVYLKPTDVIKTPTDTFTNIKLNNIYSNIQLKTTESGTYILDGSTDVTFS